jgi:hypothetical protein
MGAAGGRVKSPDDESEAAKRNRTAKWLHNTALKLRNFQRNLPGRDLWTLPERRLFPDENSPLCDGVIRAALNLDHCCQDSPFGRSF